MPIVTMPDGARVNFPDDMPSEQIKSLISSKFPQETASLSPQAGDLAPQNAEPKGEVQQGMQVWTSPTSEPMPDTKLMDKQQRFDRGVGLATRSILQGAASPVTIAPDLVTAGINAATGSKIEPLSGVVSSGLTAMGLPEPQTAQERVVGDITQGAVGAGGVAQSVKNLGTAAPKLLQKIVANPLAEASAGAGAGAASGIARESGASPLVQLGAGIAGGSLAGGVANIGNATGLNIKESIAPLVQRAKDFNIPLRADQVAPTRVRNTLQKVGQEIPLSGTGNFEEKQVSAWNSALAKTIGEDADNLNPSVVKRYLTRANNEFKDILTGEQVSISQDSIAKLKDMKQSVTRSLDASLAKVVQNNIDDVLDQIEPKNIQTGLLDSSGEQITKRQAADVSGEKLASIRGELLDNAASASGGARIAINKAVAVLDGIAAKNISPEKAAALKETRRQYRNFKTLQPLIKKSTDGNINPTQLISRIGSTNRFIKAETAGVGDDDLIDLARIGKEFLSKKGGSDTFQKAGLVGVGASLSNPVTAAIAAGTVGANRLYQNRNTSQKLIDAALKSGNKSFKLPITGAVVGANGS